MDSPQDDAYPKEPLVQSKELAWSKTLYRYTVEEDLVTMTDIIGAAAMVPGFIYLLQDGWLVVKAGYAWDGPSDPFGPFGAVDDTDDFMAGSCFHDALYQLMRTRRLSQEHRPKADNLLYRVCRRAGMSWLRAKFVLWVVRRFAAFAARPNKKTIYRAKA
jgi:hypothetical protein